MSGGGTTVATPAAGFSPATLLTRIKTVDGTGSGLDADLVRGTTPSTAGLSILALASIAVGGLLLGSGTNTVGTLAIGAASTFLKSNGTTAAWTALDAGDIGAGTLAAARGGTGVSNAGTLTNASNTTITGGGTLALAGFTLTVPATGTAGLLGTAQTWSAANIFSANLTAGADVTLSNATPILTIGSGTGAPVVRINGAAGQARSQAYYTNGSLRWNFYASAAAESGANAGSAFVLSAYSDAGGYLDDVFSVARAAGGTFTISRPVNISGTSLSVGTTLMVSSTTDATSKDTGAIITEGGIGAEKSVFSGGSFNVSTAGARYNFNVGGAYLSWIECDGVAGNNYMRFGVANSEYVRITQAGSVLLNNAAIATTATDGFLYVATCAGTPTGAPTAATGRAPIVIDSTNHKLYFYSGGSWRDAGP